MRTQPMRFCDFAIRKQSQIIFVSMHYMNYYYPLPMPTIFPEEDTHPIRNSCHFIEQQDCIDGPCFKKWSLRWNAVTG